MEDIKNKIGQRIRKKREALKMNQTDLAHKIGKSQSAINQYEKGNKKPSTIVLRQIAISLGVSTDYLLGSAGDDKIFVDKEVAAVFRDFKGLTKNDKDTIADLINVLKKRRNKQ